MINKPMTENLPHSLLLKRPTNLVLYEVFETIKTRYPNSKRTLKDTCKRKKDNTNISNPVEDLSAHSSAQSLSSLKINKNDSIIQKNNKIDISSTSSNADSINSFEIVNPISSINDKKYYSLDNNDIYKMLEIKSGNDANIDDNDTLEQMMAEASEEPAIDFLDKTHVKLLKCDLEEQLKVNAELKNLLLASVGSSLMNKLETLVQDKCKLQSQELDFNFKQRLATSSLDDLTENFGALCQSYQTKYLAAKLMNNNLNRVISYSSSIYLKIAHILTKDIAERNALKSELVKIYKLLTPNRSNKEIPIPNFDIFELMHRITKFLNPHDKDIPKDDLIISPTPIEYDLQLLLNEMNSKIGQNINDLNAESIISENYSTNLSIIPRQNIGPTKIAQKDDIVDASSRIKVV
ncbi:unnamed protein product [Gordionus sp. m RMFG-2023]|uniref:uncharacterized protein LOC135931052 isoform X1 n=1 Tax=Gordionus sp. m RMFG-2023 TaxID=3053472 RepID=UPI0030E04665